MFDSRRDFLIKTAATASATSFAGLWGMAHANTPAAGPGVTRFKEWKLFTGVPQAENFSTFHLTQSVRRMNAASRPTVMPAGRAVDLPKSFRDAQGQQKSMQAFLAESDTSAVLVLKNGQLVHEDYFFTGGREVPWMSMSVAKSFVATLVGAALNDGHIKSLEDRIDAYSPVFKGSAYDGVRIKDVLQMSSGARWNEDYSNPDSDALRLGNALSPGGSLDVFLSKTVRELQPGTVCRYNSADTQALGVLVAAAAGKSMGEYMQEKLTLPLGMEYPSYWILDEQGREMAFAGLLMTARDYAKLGELYRLEGVWNGKRILPAKFIHDATHWDAPHVQPGQVRTATGARPVGYGYQWWLINPDQGEFYAVGVYNQFIYINRSRGVVAVKLSSNRQFATKADQYSASNIPCLQAIAAAV